MKRCFTIGHSDLEIGAFINLLKQHKINCIVDVRSTPYSKFTPQYNRELLKQSLTQENIIYLHFGDEFGARRQDSELLFKDGKVNFTKVIKDRSFKQGVKRVVDGINKGFNIALMCTERDPFDCHRFAMVSRGLVEDGFEVSHILYDGSIISNNELEDRMTRKYQIEYNQFDLFGNCKTYDEAVLEGYEKLNHAIAYLNIEEE